jgi:Sulfatase
VKRFTSLWQDPFIRLLSMCTVLALVLGLGAFPLFQTNAVHAANSSSSSSCQLNSPQGKIKHVIYVQFDNTHFTRDNPNVPSDLEQMPNLLNFIESNGVLLSNHHTPLIAHTATDILTSLTGVYGARHGVPISNSFRYFNPNGTSNTGVSYAYWTAPLYDPTTSKPTDTTYNMLTANGKNAPAPWVPYTRAGCNFGAVGAANTVLENIGIDIPTVFGANSPEAAEAKANPAQATADFVGIGVHCAQSNALCSATHTGKPDLLPDEPGGYSDYKGLFGHKYVAPQISPNGPLTDLNGNVIQDSKGHIGFPGFDSMSPAVSLAYMAAMQEHNVPVTYAYISDAHDNHATATAYGPGSAGYVAALKSYDAAFGKFFARLKSDGINSSNTLFVFTADEGDHFVGSAPNPSNCDGVTTPCSYSKIGEINANMTGLLATQQGITTPFLVHADSAPNVYITGNPTRDDETVTRPFERATGKLTAVNPITGKTDTLTNYLADPVEMKLLHMITGDPARTPTFTMFANPNYFLYTDAANCTSPCITELPAFAWNHGDVAPDINTTWLGMVGPGIQSRGVNNSVWSDHTDIRPTMMELLGLKDDYSHDGRVLFEVMNKAALPKVIRQNLSLYTQLAQVYKQLYAPLGQLGMASLSISTTALESGSASDDSTYRQLEKQLQTITTQRDALASRMIATLEAGEFGTNGSASFNQSQVQKLIQQGQTLINRVEALAKK